MFECRPNFAGPWSALCLGLTMKKACSIAICIAAVCAIQSIRGQAVMDWFQAAEGAQHLAIPRYTESDKTLYAVVRVEKVETEYELHGLFRIGALPVVVLDGFTYEVKDAAPAARNLAGLPEWLGADVTRHLELRNINFVASPGNRLESQGIKFVDGERWELTGDVRLTSGTNVFRAEKATLRVAGTRAGEIVLQTSPPTTNTFLFDKLPEISKPTAMTTASK